MTATAPEVSGGSPEAFDLTGDLPGEGTLVLEASAGTGKTYAIAALAARYVAEAGIGLSELMMVTFGRMATDELRDRVRDRLLTTERQLAAALGLVPGVTPQAELDEVGRHLTSAEPAELARRHDRVLTALADFDAATIATTHEFCLRMLDGLGVLGDRQPDAVFTEHLTELTAEVADDVYLSRYAGGNGAAAEGSGIGYEEAVRLARATVGHAHAALVPDPADAGGDQARERVAYAVRVRDEVNRRKDRSRLFSYDDMLTRLRDALAHPRTGPLAAQRLRQQFRVVLVDEFQDTDPIQWEILQRAFHGHSTLVLIGDPKQAIYAFRGADVYSYLDAVRQSRQFTLDTNYRSDRDLIEALQSLMGGAALGEPDIVVRPVQAHHQQSRLHAADGSTLPALRIRVVPPDLGQQDPSQPVRVGILRPRIQADLVADITRRLGSGERLLTKDEPGGRPLRASDIAVLVRTNSRGEAIRDALQTAGVPAVMLGSTSVFASSVADDWRTLLVALADPRQPSTRRAALTCFLGMTAHELALADDETLTRISQRIRFWSRVLGSRGVAAVLEVIGTDTDLTRRLLARTGGERILTDLRHIGQALHAAMTAGRLGPAALVEWLEERIRETGPEHGGVAGGPDVVRRLESDAQAVQILTLHRSKGLEFPIVYLPEAWDKRENTQDDGAPLLVHEPPDDASAMAGGRAGRCVLDVGGTSGTGRGRRWNRGLDEEAGEELRLLYVGLTRAGSQAVTWWANSWNTPTSPLHRFLSRTGGDSSVERRYPVPSDPSSEFAARATITWEEVGAASGPGAPVNSPQPAPGPPLGVRTFDRALDLDWRRTSYSALTAAAHGAEAPVAGVSSEAEPVREDDEPVDESPGAEALGEPGPQPVTAVDSQAGLDLSTPSPLREFPGGTDFGTLVHAVLETVDPQAQDLSAALAEAAAAAIAQFAPGSTRAEDLATALLPTLRTPLGPLAGGRTLADIAATDRLAELGFELPLAGGDTPAAGSAPVPAQARPLVLGDLVPLLRRSLEPGDPLAGYPDRLAHPLLADQPLRGYLTGSIDAVLRVDGPRYLVVDYKTNWLGTFDGPQLSLGDYTPARMAEAMMRAHYPLQALLYCVALHRLLRWRQPGYDPAQHLGGVLYLFVRGMAGPQTPVVAGSACGVFDWRPAPELVVEVSDLLDRGAPDAGGSSS